MNGRGRRAFVLLAALILAAVVVAALLRDDASQAPAVVDHRDPSAKARSESDNKPRQGPGKKQTRAAAISPNAVSFWDESRGITGGGFLSDGSPGTISLTTDGGETFEVVYETHGGVGWVQAAGTHTAWAQVDPGGGEKSEWFLRSSDGGRTWERLPDTSAWSPSFATPNRGLAVAGKQDYSGGILHANELVRTSDGGRSWQSAPTPCPDRNKRPYYDGMVVSVAATSEAWALCVGEPVGPHQPSYLFTSSNGGENWSPVELEGDDIRVPTPLGMSFAPGGIGIVWGTSEAITRDAGRTWKPAPGLDYVRFADMVAPDLGFALGNRGSGRGQLLFRTRDGGVTWERLHHWPRPRSPSRSQSTG